MIEVYTAIQAKIKAVAPKARTVERFFGQLAMAAAGDGNTVIFPAVYFELVNIRCSTRSKGIQDCEGTLRLRHCDQALVVSQLRTLDLEQSTYLGISGFRGDTIRTGLDRSAIYPDPTFRGVEVIITEYPIQWVDSTLFNHLYQPLDGSTVTKESSVSLQ
jgi:hypothetical protein